jgi:hypothetical protein
MDGHSMTYATTHTPAAPDWQTHLPAEFAALAIPPHRFESHDDEAALARKVVGLDVQGRRCFLLHTHTVTEDRFDIDEFPLEVPVLHACQIAWRLASGEWLSIGEQLDRLESCRPRHQRSGPQLTTGIPHGL